MSIKESIMKRNGELSVSFGGIGKFKLQNNDAVRLKIIDNSLSKYKRDNFGDNQSQYLKYINNIANYIEENINKKNTISKDTLCELHKIIILGLPQGDNSTAGKIRTHVGYNSGKMLIHKAKKTYFLEPKKIESYLENSINDFNKNISNDAITSIVNLVLDIWIYIHPFSDGNGKVCYILLDTLLWKYDYWPLFLSHENNIMHFRELLQRYSDTLDLENAKKDFYKLIVKVYKNYQIT